MTTSWDSFISQILLNETAHYFWLRSLSYLEYIGYRKMVKALAYEQVSRSVFHHLSDEIRHSYMLKELADKLLVKITSDWPGSRDSMEITRCFEQNFIPLSEGYFQDLDGAVEKWVSKYHGEAKPFHCYLMTSYLIEIRAMLVYPSYHQVLKSSSEQAVIQQIVKDEREHLKELQQKAKTLQEDFSLDQEELLNFEAKRFEKYLADFEHCLKLQSLRLSA